MLCSGRLVRMVKAAEMGRKTCTQLNQQRFREELAKDADGQVAGKMRAFIGEQLKLSMRMSGQ
jgi:hypothetical protein